MKPCTLYKGHLCTVIENHHICPKSWWEAAGKPINTPMALICPNCHMDVHYAIDTLLRSPDPAHLRGIPPRAIQLARQALDIAGTNGLIPAPTL